MSKEPAAIIATITALVSAVLVFLKSMGVDITEDQQDAIRGVVAVVAPIVAGLIIRYFVVSPQATGEAVAHAKAQDPSSAILPDVKVQGYRAAAAGELGLAPSAFDWRPPVDAH